MNVDSEFVGAFLEAFRPRLLALYVTVAFLTGWVGLLSTQVLFEPTEMADATVFANRVQLLVFILVGIPFVEPLAIAATRCWLEGEA
jgi:hypothetical protein